MPQPFTDDLYEIRMDTCRHPVVIKTNLDCPWIMNQDGELQRVPCNTCKCTVCKASWKCF